jgi:hypothetical protein
MSVSSDTAAGLELVCKPREAHNVRANPTVYAKIGRARDLAVFVAY